MLTSSVKTLASALLLLLLLAAVAAAGSYVYLRHRHDGFSARAEPSRVESFLAQEARRAATPAAARARRNPVADSSQVFDESMKHYADHCAVCHGNDGGGDTMFGHGMYPKPPDLRATTLADGELFRVIEDGVRMSGMPAFGSPGDDGTDSWKLVRFLRRLPSLTPKQIAAMGAMNPKSPDERKEEMQEEQFLSGK